MKSVHGAYNTKLNEKDVIIIPLWFVFKLGEWNNVSIRKNIDVEKRAFCLYIYDTEIKEISIIESLKKVFNNKSHNKYNEGVYQLAVISWNSLILELDKKIEDLKILDLDFIKDLEYEEVREMFGNKEYHPELWKICSWT